MLGYLKNIFTSSGTPKTPSLLVVIGTFGRFIDVLHFLPEDGSIERFAFTCYSPTFNRRGASEEAREQIGTVTIYAGDGEGTGSFLDDVALGIRERWKAPLNLDPAQLHTGSAEVTRLMESVLRPAALDAIHKREDRPRSMNATQTHDVFIVRVIRKKDARLSTTNPTSFPD